MKTEYLFVILLVLIGFSSCEDSTSDATLELSQSTFENISSDGATLTVNITSSDSWTAASSSTACNLVPNQGTSNQSLSIVVEANLDEAERNMTVVVTSGGIKKTISISQQGRSTTAGEYHYNLPVIQTFTSTNIMDYSVSYSDRFTNDQRSRIRHVLTYSPLIPGPKQGQTQTRSVVEGPIDLPIRTAR